MKADGHVFPIAIPIQNRGDGLFIDTVLWNERDLSRIFSFTRAYFMVDVIYPNEMVEFLLDLLPNKKAWELYILWASINMAKLSSIEVFLTT